jgi:hypothetical protein
MSSHSDELNRAHKLLMDRDQLRPEEAAARFDNFSVTIVCGKEIATSPTLQAAVLTAANVANRVRQGSLRIVPPISGKNPSLLVPWPAASFFDAISNIAPNSIFQDQPLHDRTLLLFGDRSDCKSGLQVTFNGWSVAVGPVGDLTRASERDHCVVAGVAAGALGVSELFMSEMGVSLEAATRTVGLSLWRPELSWSDPRAIGPEIAYLPNEFWSLGLGHLGQAYLWCLGLLPYTYPEKVNIILQDFDRGIKANIGTCALMGADDIGLHKTRICRRWLEARGFRPAIFERAFDEQTKCANNEPALALCGFDGKGPRHLLDDAGFRRVVECGLGGRFDNFDTILMHTLPRDEVRSADFWNPVNRQQTDPIVQALLDENPNYRLTAESCGVIQLDRASRSVAVPFVGAIAGSLGVAEILRMAHGGESFGKIDMRLASPRSIATTKGRLSYEQKSTKLDFQNIRMA